jgi:hypothetical protein
MQLIQKHVEQGIAREESFNRSGKTLLRGKELDAPPAAGN